MNARMCTTIALVSLVLALLVTTCAYTPTPQAGGEPQIVRDDPAPDEFVGASWAGLIGDLTVIGLWLSLFLSLRGLRRSTDFQEWDPWLRRGIWVLTAFSVLGGLWWVANFVCDIYVTWLAYQEMGYLYNWLLEMGTRIVLLVSAFAVSFAAVWAMFRPLTLEAMAKLAESIPEHPGPEPSRYASQEHYSWEAANKAYRRALRMTQELRVFATILKAIPWLVGVIVGLVFASKWLDMLMFINQVPWGSVDPVFGKDVGFFVFTLPLWNLVLDSLFWIFALGVVGVIIAHLYFYWEEPETPWGEIIRRMGTPLALWFLVAAVSTGLGCYDLMFTEGTKYGGITTVQLRVETLARILMTVITAVAALVIGIASQWGDRIVEYIQSEDRRTRRKRLAIVTSPFSFLVVAAIFLLLICPWAYYAFKIAPKQDENQVEQIAWNIQATRDAFGLSDVRVLEQEIQLTPDPDALVMEKEPWLSGIRLWDWRAIERFLDQRHVPTKLTLWDFVDVDVTRIETEGLKRLIMVSLREPQPYKLGDPTFPVKNIRAISSIGFAAVDPSGIDTDLHPKMIAESVPVRVAFDELDGIALRSYYTEAAVNVTFVNTEGEEYTVEGLEVPEYEDAGGARLPLLRRLALGWHLKSWPVLMGQYFTPETRALLNRNIIRRVQAIAGPLGITMEWDPYWARCGDRTCFLWDGYTTTNGYPEATAFEMRFPDTMWRSDYHPQVRYFRNSVKVVVDALSGRVDFYIADEDDPLILTLSRLLPGMFKPLSQMPDDLQARLRVPETSFDTLLEIAERYHVTNPLVFWGNKEAWQRATELADVGQTGMIESRYYIGNLPDHEESETLLVNAFTPLLTRNLSGVMIARNDRGVLGEIHLYELTTGEGLERITGPTDAEIKADQVPQIAAALTNWEARGNWVIPGNVMILFVGRSIVYSEPITLVPKEEGSAPTLNLVILTPLKGQPAYHVDLPHALRALRGEIPSYAPVISGVGEEPFTGISAPIIPLITPSADCAVLSAQIADALARFNAGETSAAEELARMTLELAFKCTER